MNKLVLIAGGSTLVYAGLALIMGVLPGMFLSRTPPSPGVKPLTSLEAEGRAVYVANGCSYCHTQQVRPLEQDKVFGRPSAPGDFAYQTPELLGSERTGPDLTNIGARQANAVWQYIHLYNPRAVVPQSIMPSFSWLFDVVDKAPQGVNAVSLPKDYAPSHGVVVPSHKAQALLAYLLSLKQTPWPNNKMAANGDHEIALWEPSSKSLRPLPLVVGLPLATTRKKDNSSSVPIAPFVIRKRARVCPVHFPLSKEMRWSMMQIRPLISISSCTASRGRRWAASNTTARCPISPVRSTTPISRTSSIMSAVRGVITASKLPTRKWQRYAPKESERRASWNTIWQGRCSAIS